MEELKRCPFCGGEAKSDYAINDYNRWGVFCLDCGASVEVADYKDEDTKDNAIRAWNKRKDS